MNPENITFEAASIDTILWPEEGFDPEGEDGIIGVGEKLTKEFDNKHLLDELCDEFDFNKEGMGNYIHPEYERSKGREHIRLTKFTNIEMCGVTAKDMIMRVYVCDRTVERRAKITVSANFDFKNHPLNAMELTDLMNRIFEKEHDICKFIYGKIPESCHLGDINYVSSIASVESGDKDLNDIIGSVLVRSDENIKFKYMSNLNQVSESKTLDAYYVLLSGKLLLSTDRESITPEKIIDAISKRKAIQSKIVIYQSNEQIPAKTLNCEVVPNDYRLITNLTEPRSAIAVTSRLVNDYLSIT